MPVEVDTPTLDGAAKRQCAELDRRLPDTVADQSAREVETDGVAAAWGDPEIVLRCGTTAAVGLGPASRCDMVNGVGWYSEELDDGYRFTTIGRAVPIELTVPEAYAPEANAVVDVAAAVKATVPVRQPCV